MPLENHIIIPPTKVYKVGEKIYAIISPSSRPFANLIVLAEVEDAIFNISMPQYQIRILEFLDEKEYIERYIYDNKFKDYRGKHITNSIPPFKKRHETIKGLNEDAKDKFKKRKFFVSALNTDKTKKGILHLFSNIANYIIQENLRIAMEQSLRLNYEGVFKIENKEKAKKELSILFDKAKEEIIEELLNPKPTIQLHKTKIEKTIIK